MLTAMFALRIEPDRVVAAEVSDRVAAALLDAGEHVFLGNPESLAELAHRLGRGLVTISRSIARADSGRASLQRDRQPTRTSLPLAQTRVKAKVEGRLSRAG